MKVFVNNNARFCCQRKEKVLSSNTFGGMQIATKKIKMKSFIEDDLEKRSSDESDNEDDNDSNDEKKSDNNNNESNE